MIPKPEIAYWIVPQIPLGVAVAYLLFRIVRDRSFKNAGPVVSSLGTFAATFAVVYLIRLGVRSTAAFILFFSNLEKHTFVIPWGISTFLIYLIFADLWFYLFHRASHLVPILWASHGVHHTGETMDPSLSLRHSFLDEFLVVIFLIIPALLGFSVFPFLFCSNVVLAYQVFCHTEKNWPIWMERYFITPQFHRVHHCRDVRTLEKNFGGVLLVWDQVFRTEFKGKIEDEIKPAYGLADGFSSHNPVKILFYIPVKILKDVWATKNPLRLFWWFPNRERV